MKMRALVLRAGDKERVADAIERARANPLPMDYVLELAQSPIQEKVNQSDFLSFADKAGLPRRPAAAIKVNFDDGYNAVFSFEEQPSGLVRHLSVSVNESKRLPSQEALLIIMELFGFGDDPEQRNGWVEEYMPDHFAVNVAELAEPAHTAAGSLH